MTTSERSDFCLVRMRNTLKPVISASLFTPRRKLCPETDYRIHPLNFTFNKILHVRKRCPFRCLSMIATCQNAIHGIRTVQINGQRQYVPCCTLFGLPRRQYLCVNTDRSTGNFSALYSRRPSIHKRTLKSISEKKRTSIQV